MHTKGFVLLFVLHTNNSHILVCQKSLILRARLKVVVEDGGLWPGIPGRSNT